MTTTAALRRSPHSGSAGGTVVRAALLGLATGGRTTAPLAALAWSPRVGGLLAGRRHGRGARARRARIAASLAFAGELTGDKLPQTPSRLAAPGLSGRLVFGAAGGLGLAMLRTGRSAREASVSGEGVAAMATGLSAAAIGGCLGLSWRRSRPFASDLPAALLEDAVVVVLAAVATRA